MVLPWDKSAAAERQQGPFPDPPRGDSASCRSNRRDLRRDRGRQRARHQRAHATAAAGRSSSASQPAAAAPHSVSA